jgi:hypothetical protein
MKRLISIILFLTMVVILIGCAGMQTQQPRDKDSLTNEVGKGTFVGGVPFHVDPKFALIGP